MAMGGFNGREGPALLKSLILLALISSAFPSSPRLLSAADLPAARPAPLPSPAEEEIGDRWRARAEPGYRRTLQSLEMAGRFAGRLSDRAAATRILEARAGLLVLLLDARSFAALKESELVEAVRRMARARTHS